MVSRDSDTVKISINGRDEEYKILKVFEFTSDRKMMSVVVKRVSDGKFLVFTKGADDKVAPLGKDSSIASRVEKQVNKFAQDGYRTLMFAMREIK